MEPLLVRAARREPLDRPPVWFMRQAGRSLPEYRALREQHTFWEVAQTPELCAEVTLQPVRRHDVDAAVMFADIMTPVLALGVDVELREGIGPVIDPPIRTAADVARLQLPEPDAFGLLEGDPHRAGSCVTPRRLSASAAGRLRSPAPRPGQAVARYAVKRSHVPQPAVWNALMETLSTTAGYVAAQVSAGADVAAAVRSWVGVLSPADYAEFVAPWSARILAAAGVPTIHFGTGTSTLLPAMAAAGGDVIGLDWRLPLDDGWARVGERGVQGNLDPAVQLGPWERLEAAANDALAHAPNRPGHNSTSGTACCREPTPRC